MPPLRCPRAPDVITAEEVDELELGEAVEEEERRMLLADIPDALASRIPGEGARSILPPLSAPLGPSPAFNPNPFRPERFFTPGWMPSPIHDRLPFLVISPYH